MQRDRETVHRSRRHKRIRRYAFRAAGGRDWRRTALAALMCAMLAFSVWQLVCYAADYAAARRTAEQLRGMYYDTTAQTAEPSAAPAQPISPQQSADTAAPAGTASATATPRIPDVLRAVRYPDNPHMQVSERFARLREEYGDVVGWLTIEGMLDEAVVQRDNIYYMTRDFRGRSNVNGALFLDEFVRLETRPYTLTIYGHNMRTGAMFGSLRKYEELEYYRTRPFITFNTMYEEGRYVVFAVARVSVDAQDERFFDLDSLDSRAPRRRSEAIRALQQRSGLVVGVDVQVEDQLLLLVTCVDEETDRRIVAARRLRPGETEQELRTLTEQAWTTDVGY